MPPMMRILLPAITAAALTAAALPSVADAQAQPPAGQSQPSRDIPDPKLDATAAAMQQVASLRRQYQQRLEEATAADKDRVLAEGNDALMKAVTDQGLSVDEYSTILQVAQNDPTVRERLMQRLRPDKN